MKDFQENEDLTELIHLSVCVLQFGDEACRPCLALRNRMSQWLEKHSEATGRYINIRKFPKLSAQMGIFSVPIVLVYVGGSLTIRESGYFSLDEILRRSERYIQLLAEAE